MPFDDTNQRSPEPDAGKSNDMLGKGISFIWEWFIDRPTEVVGKGVVGFTHFLTGLGLSEVAKKQFNAATFISKPVEESFPRERAARRKARKAYEKARLANIYDLKKDIIKKLKKDERDRKTNTDDITILNRQKNAHEIGRNKNKKFNADKAQSDINDLRESNQSLDIAIELGKQRIIGINRAISNNRIANWVRKEIWFKVTDIPLYSLYKAGDLALLSTQCLKRYPISSIVTVAGISFGVAFGMPEQAKQITNLASRAAVTVDTTMKMHRFAEACDSNFMLVTIDRPKGVKDCMAQYEYDLLTDGYASESIDIENHNEETFKDLQQQLEAARDVADTVNRALAQDNRYNAKELANVWNGVFVTVRAVEAQDRAVLKSTAAEVADKIGDVFSTNRHDDIGVLFKDISGILSAVKLPEFAFRGESTENIVYQILQTANHESQFNSQARNIPESGRGGAYGFLQLMKAAATEGSEGIENYTTFNRREIHNNLGGAVSSDPRTSMQMVEVRGAFTSYGTAFSTFAYIGYHQPPAADLFNYKLPSGEPFKGAGTYYCWNVGPGDCRKVEEHMRIFIKLEKEKEALEGKKEDSRLWGIYNARRSAAEEAFRDLLLNDPDFAQRNPSVYKDADKNVFDNPFELSDHATELLNHHDLPDAGLTMLRLWQSGFTMGVSRDEKSIVIYNSAGEQIAGPIDPELPGAPILASINSPRQ